MHFSVLTGVLFLHQKRKTIDLYGVTLTATEKMRNLSGNTSMDFLFDLIILFINTDVSEKVEPWVNVRFEPDLSFHQADWIQPSSRKNRPLLIMAGMVVSANPATPAFYGGSCP
ncbi:hypothetical protein [Oceanobacter sp. 4_MG-2023]|uniref:hypothetical protein n=1 Tax=Oceanobacter sp. 4_MG-2023 TaxID=3062623 RepID=UPI00273305C7|nr:hypothetical protein [Oceanobacter sp. 4_MG-2023]MDP2549100.1 hypothetical protein [Oceanobacter sp. 4_MG-2023]